MKLYDLFSEIQKIDFEDREVSDVTDNSSKIKKDCVFVCVKGGSFDGHTVAEEAL